MTKKFLTLENIRSGAVPSDAVAVGFLLGELEKLRTQMEILQRANRFLSEQIPSALEPLLSPVATPGATVASEDSLKTRGESSRPRELLPSEAASFAKTLARSPRIISQASPDASSYPEEREERQIGALESFVSQASKLSRADDPYLWPLAMGAMMTSTPKPNDPGALKDFTAASLPVEGASRNASSEKSGEGHEG